jgi:hypothetical protein
MMHEDRTDTVVARSRGFLFPELPPLDVDESFMLRLGHAGGLCDGSAHADAEPDTAREAAGWPFLGQFLSHDLSSQLSRIAEIDTLRIALQQKLDLEAIYGSGPIGNPYFYDINEPAKLLVGQIDLPRNAQGIAIIAEPRNDSNRVLSQLHLLFMRFHNAVVDWLGDPELRTAQQLVRWHYHWVLLHDYLPRVIGPSLAEELIECGPRYFNRPMSAPYVPLEFVAAAGRYGHGQIRSRYQINATTTAALFPDLIGDCPAEPAHVVDWAYLFDLEGRPPAQRARRIDGRLPRSLYQLPAAISSKDESSPLRSLSYRDLVRGKDYGLPSGETIARHLGLVPLTPDEIGLAAMGWGGETPLWYYVLRESAVRADGDQLGPVGGRILGEVMVGLIDHEPQSFRVTDPAWRPVLPSRIPGDFTLADLITFVGH